jgi:hypothetical protein
MTAAYHKEILIGLNEDTVRARRIRIKSTTPMKTTSRLHVIANATVEKTIPDKKYDDYHGSTRNDMLSLVALPPYELGWNLPLKDKIEVYNHKEGSRRVTTAAEARCSGFMVSGCILKHIVLVSQASPADGILSISEPVFHGGLPVNLWKNTFQAYGSKGVIDLSAGEGEVCKAAMTLRKPCLAFCFTDLHVKMLFDHLVTWMLANMADPGSIYHNQNYKTFKAGLKPADVAKPAEAVPKRLSTASTAPPEKRHRSENASRRRGKKRKSKGKKSSSSSESSSED